MREAYFDRQIEISPMVWPENTWLKRRLKELRDERRDYVTPADEKILLKFTVAMEAEGEPFEGKLAVAYTIMNRVRQWKKSVSDVCLNPFQFSAWNTDSPTRKRLDEISSSVMLESARAAEYAYNKQFEDPSNGATHYLNEDLTRQIRGDGSLPSWVEKMKKVAEIGRHTFYRDK